MRALLNKSSRVNSSFPVFSESRIEESIGMEIVVVMVLDNCSNVLYAWKESQLV
jgi:hypothetical protein